MLPATRADSSPPFIVGLQVRPYNWQMRQARKAMGLTQVQLATLADTDVGTIQELETLKKSHLVQWGTCDRVADILDQPADALFPTWIRPKLISGLASGDLPVRLTEDMATDDGALFQNTLRAEMVEVLTTALESLPEREQRVLRYRFGLGDGKSCTLKEVGCQLGISRERAGVLEAQGLRRLRHPSRAEALRPYLELVGLGDRDRQEP